jgi:hypothetical protein
MLVTEYMEGGDLFRALQRPTMQQPTRWCAPLFSCLPKSAGNTISYQHRSGNVMFVSLLLAVQAPNVYMSER